MEEVNKKYSKNPHKDPLQHLGKVMQAPTADPKLSHNVHYAGGMHEEALEK